MPLHYFKPDTMIGTRCEHCGAQRKESLERLYSDARLVCSVCGQEHTFERSRFRQTVEDTEALVESLSVWTDRMADWLRRWRKDR